MDSSRADWSEVWLDVATAVAKRSSCGRSLVGAVLVLMNVDSYVGYNGPRKGELNCDQGGCPRGLKSFEELPSASSFDGVGRCTAVHAEMNALLRFQHSNQTTHVSVRRLMLSHSVLYITREPCEDCWHQILRTGMTRDQVVWPDK